MLKNLVVVEAKMEDRVAHVSAIDGHWIDFNRLILLSLLANTLQIMERKLILQVVRATIELGIGTQDQGLIVRDFNVLSGALNFPFLV